MNNRRFLLPWSARVLTIALATFAVVLAGCIDSFVAPDTAVDGASAAAKVATSTSPVYTWPPATAIRVEGATAELVRTKNGHNFKFTTNSLTPGHAYTLWVVIFNEPDQCATTPCTGRDLFNPDSKPDMLSGAGGVVGGAGKATFAGRTHVRDASGSVQAPLGLDPNGLIDPMGAEIHFVLKSHGPKNAAYMPDMIQTLAGGCTDAGIPEAGASSPWNDYDGPEYGRRGPNTCEDVQFAVLQP